MSIQTSVFLRPDAVFRPGRGSGRTWLVVDPSPTTTDGVNIHFGDVSARDERPATVAQLRALRAAVADLCSTYPELAEVTIPPATAWSEGHTTPIEDDGDHFVYPASLSGEQ